jgi:arylsulfatase A-like enzyme
MSSSHRAGTNRRNEFGAPGEVASDIGKNLDQGTHSTLSPHDLYNTLVASGPDFRSGWNDEIPTGNIDVAPTILALLGLKSPEPMEGRIFTEALRKGKSAPAVHEQELVAERKLGDATWRQTLRLTTVGTTTYVSGGNGGIVGEKP